MEKYSEYKDSGVQWLGEIPCHWNEKRISSQFTGDVECNKDFLYKRAFKFNYGSLVPKNEIGDPEEYRDVYVKYSIVKPGDVLVNGLNLNYDFVSQRIACAPADGIITSAYVVCRPRHGVNYDFFTWLFKAMDSKKLFHGMGSGIRLTLSFKELKKQLIPIPPLSEQHAIVSYLDDKCGKIDQLLENKAKEIELCKEAIESMIFSSNDNTPTSISSWETCFPESWETKLGRALFEEVKIKGSQEDRFLAVTQDNGLIYKDGGDVNFVTAENKETQKLVSPGQFVISLRSFEGGIEYSNKQGLISAAYVVLKLREQYDSEELRMYYRFLFKSKPFVQRLNTISDSMRDGKSIKFKDIRYFKFPIPSEDRLRRILEYIRVYDKLNKTFREERERLVEYKQRLISDVVTGQIKVC